MGKIRKGPRSFVAIETRQPTGTIKESTLLKYKNLKGKTKQERIGRILTTKSTIFSVCKFKDFPSPEKERVNPLAKRAVFRKLYGKPVNGKTDGQRTETR